MSDKYRVRDKDPIRNCDKIYRQYRSYKKYLEVDFNQQCGYCGDHHSWLGGSLSYHIDHFAPKIKFTDLTNDYQNLVYACPFCNRFKSDDWPSEDHTINIVEDKGYIDPCDETYETHFYRNNLGSIIPSTPVGEYIHKKLNLDLARHRVLWNLTRLHRLKFQIKQKLEDTDLPKEKKTTLMECYFELSKECDNYMENYLGIKF